MEEDKHMPRIVVVGDHTTRSPLPASCPESPEGDDDRPPLCPVCQRRFVIIAMRPGRNAAGKRIRRQVWGCPFAHATTYRSGGVFEPIEVYAGLDD